MTKNVDTWHQLAALVPPAEAQEIRDCWDIGEQEAGLGLMVSGILSNDVAISETVRAQISVLAETWGEREALTPRILQCRSDGQSAETVTLVEQDGSLVSGDKVTAERDLSGLILVPWISCSRCGQVLTRVHAREAWGDLSYLARNYAITTPDRAVAAQLFAADSAGKAFDSLRRSCHQLSSPTADGR
ncbi:hypothetical protein [Streptomyces mirabilis]|uniref:hypothetical protein n=1 Tax=Streptomyces mirabilis TaxID=68239 RepID=UPI0033FBD094